MEDPHDVILDLGESKDTIASIPSSTPTSLNGLKKLRTVVSKGSVKSLHAE